MDEEVSSKFSYCIYKCSIEYRELLPFLELMEYNPTDVKFATIRINVKNSTFIHFEYNPEWIKMIHRDILYFFMLVEAMKIVLHHPTRIGNADAGNIVAKMAASNVVAGLDIPANSKFKPEVQDFDWLVNITGKAIDKESLTYEKAYKYLVTAFKNQPNMQMPNLSGLANKQNNPQGQDKGNGQPSGDSNDNSNGNDNSNQNKGSNDTQDKSDGNGQNGQSSENKSPSQKKSQRDLIKQHYDAANQAWQLQAYGENLIVDDQITKEFEANGGIDAFNKGYSRTGSKYSRTTKKMLFDSNTWTYDMRKVLNRFAADVRTQYVETSRMRYNRRYGLAQPGYRHKYQSKVAICFDRSGSMSNKEDIEHAIGIINSALKYAEVWYCEWDTKCTEFTKVKKDFSNVSENGGGTDPQCVIDYIKEKGLQFNGLIFITDNEYNWNMPNIAAKISILGTGDSTQPPAWCRYFMRMRDLIRS